MRYLSCRWRVSPIFVRIWLYLHVVNYWSLTTYVYQVHRMYIDWVVSSMRDALLHGTFVYGAMQHARLGRRHRYALKGVRGGVGVQQGGGGGTTSTMDLSVRAEVGERFENDGVIHLRRQQVKDDCWDHCSSGHSNGFRIDEGSEIRLWSLGGVKLIGTFDYIMKTCLVGYIGECIY